eukprot:m.220799 g.220799  ORF g.220799 m.220799 type:complete len:207 (+) comp10460_c0_seq1:117-737(+)
MRPMMPERMCKTFNERLREVFGFPTCDFSLLLVPNAALEVGALPAKPVSLELPAEIAILQVSAKSAAILCNDHALALLTPASHDRDEFSFNFTYEGKEAVLFVSLDQDLSALVAVAGKPGQLCKLLPLPKNRRMFRFEYELSMRDCKHIAQYDGTLYSLDRSEYVLYFFVGLLPDHVCAKYGGEWAIAPYELPPNCVQLSDLVKAG